MKINGNELKIGMLIQLKGRLLSVVKTQHVKPGKGGAFMQTELKDIRNGGKLNERFRSDETVEKVRLDEIECQFLYKDGSMYAFMDNDTFDQFQLSHEVIGDEVAQYLTENMVVNISKYDEEILGVILPENMTFLITEADPVVKGQTASSSYKSAILENGMRVQVPPHVEAGMKIVISTSDASYVERAK